MADEGLKITDATLKPTLDGTEEIPANSLGNDVKITAQAIASLADVGDNPVDKIDFIPQVSVLEHETGRMFFDSVKDAMTYYNSESEISMQIGLELWVRCYNAGATINNGTNVYIIDADITTKLPKIGIADSSDYNKSRIIGKATHTIENDSKGYVAFFGVVNDVDTSSFSAGDTVYLGAAGIDQNTFPAGGEYPTRIGTVLESAVSGSIQLNISTSEYTVESLQQTGWPRRGTNVTRTFDEVTRTLTIAPTDGIKERFYQQGVKYLIEGAGTSFQISDVSGLHLLYFDEGVIYESVNPSPSLQESIYENGAIVEPIYWRQGDREIYRGEQPHCSIGYGSRALGIDSATVGAQYVNDGGIELGDFTIGSGSIDADAQFSISSGTIKSSDLILPTSAFNSTAGTDGIYYETPTLLQRAANIGFSFFNTGTGRVAYQDPTLGGLVEAPDNSYVLTHMLANDDGSLTVRTVLFTPGLASYSSAQDAYDAAISEGSFIVNSMPIKSVVYVGSVILQTRNSYSNSVKARVVQTPDGDNYIDTRLITSVGGGGGGGPTVTKFSDAEFAIFDSVNLYEKTDELGNYSASHVITWPDKSMTPAGIDDIKGEVAITVNDTTKDYLDSKFTVGDEFTKEIVNPSANESLLLKFKGWIYNATRTFYHAIVSNSTANRTLTLADADLTINKDNLIATASPTVLNDNTEGYSVGSTWIDVTNDNVYKCVDATTGSAIWKWLNQSYVDYDLSFALSDETSDLTTDNDGSIEAIRAQTIQSITFSVNTAPTGSTILVDVLKNGTTILTSSISLPTSTTSVTITPPQIDVTNISMGDIIKADITQIGSTIAGSGAKIYIKTELA